MKDLFFRIIGILIFCSIVALIFVFPIAAICVAVCFYFLIKLVCLILDARTRSIQEETQDIDEQIIDKVDYTQLEEILNCNKIKLHDD